MQEEALQGNESIEQAIAALQQNATPELLAHALTAIRRRIRENGQFVVAVEPNPDEPKSRADPRRPRLVVRLYQL